MLPTGKGMERIGRERVMLLVASTDKSKKNPAHPIDTVSIHPSR